MEPSQWGKRKGLMLFTSVRRCRRCYSHTMPQINLISCHNCSENVTSWKLIPTDDFFKKIKNKGREEKRIKDSLKDAASKSKVNFLCKKDLLRGWACWVSLNWGVFLHTCLYIFIIQGDTDFYFFYLHFDSNIQRPKSDSGPLSLLMSEINIWFKKLNSEKKSRYLKLV